jgi:hypothetical protein
MPGEENKVAIAGIYGASEARSVVVAAMDDYAELLARR